MTIILFLLFFVLFVSEVFSYRGMRFLLSSKQKGVRRLWQTLYWLWTLLVFGFVMYALFNRGEFSNPKRMNFAFVIIGLFLANFFFKMIFGWIHLLNEGATFFANLFMKKTTEQTGNMSRSKFLSTAGLALASIPFGGLVYGMIWGRYHFRVVRLPLQIKNLPDAFVGKTIVQLSDLHLGSFPQKTNQVAKAVEQVNALQADYLFFTGDMINERAIEMEPWIKTLKKLQVKEGKYSVLGNHDYGDYYPSWQGKPDKIEANVQYLHQLQNEIGFELLRNENRLLTQGNESIRLIGLENWGEGRFSKYGDLQKSLQGVKNEEVQILLSHDPSHWDAQVLGKTKIDVAMAGHTHGFQLGVELPGIKWSPAQYRYKRWAGLYKEGEQQLYVNRGLGYIGYAGRIGIWPEITLFTLERDERFG